MRTSPSPCTLVSFKTVEVKMETLIIKRERSRWSLCIIFFNHDVCFCIQSNLVRCKKNGYVTSLVNDIFHLRKHEKNEMYCTVHYAIGLFVYIKAEAPHRQKKTNGIAFNGIIPQTHNPHPPPTPEQEQHTKIHGAKKL